MASQRIEVTAELVDQLAQAAGLSLRPGRATVLIPLVQGILKDAATLEEVDVAGCEPPVVFRYDSR